MMIQYQSDEATSMFHDSQLTTITSTTTVRISTATYNIPSYFVRSKTGYIYKERGALFLKMWRENLKAYI